MDRISVRNDPTDERLCTLARGFPWPAERPVIEPPREHLGWLDGGVRQLLAEEVSADTLLIVELGAWLGLTTRFLADLAPGAMIAAIDHWQGSPEHHERPEWRAMLPALYEGFLTLCWPYRDRIVPLRMTTLAGLQVLADHGLSPDLVYVDAEHTYQAVRSELKLSGQLFPRAALVGDDYPHPPVRDAVVEFAQRHGLVVQCAGNGWRLVREGDGAHGPTRA